MTNFRIHIVPSPRASSHFLGDQLSHSYSIISKGKLTLPWWPPSHSYHTISKGRTSSKTAGIDLELDFELDLVYNNFWATTLELEACHYWNNLPENIRVWGRHIISSSIYYCTKWDFKAPCLSFSLFSFPGYHRRTKIFLGSVIAWENTPETSVFPEVWVPSLCCYPGALTLGMALSLGIYPKLNVPWWTLESACPKTFTFWLLSPQFQSRTQRLKCNYWRYLTFNIDFFIKIFSYVQFIMQYPLLISKEWQGHYG